MERLATPRVNRKTLAKRLLIECHKTVTARG